MADSFPRSALVRRSQDQVSSTLLGEEVILHLTSETYYSLNDVGTRVWELLDQPRTVGELLDVLLQEYHVEASACEGDLNALLREMAQERLIEFCDGTVEIAPTV